MQIKVDESNIGKRLDAFISENREEISRSLAQKLITENKIKVNNNASKASYKIKLDDVIDIDENSLKTTSEGIVPEDIKIDILYEDDDILVVNKPKNMVVHPGSGVKTRYFG